MFGIGIPEILIFLIGLFLYVIPSIIAIRRNHNNSMAIVILNLIAGWTFIGWVIALVWSLTNNVEMQTESNE